MVRRRALAALFVVAACGTKEARAPAPAGPPPLHLTPLSDLAPAAGLVWLVEARPLEIAQNAALIASVAELVPEERMRRFAAKSGGVDARAMDALVVAEYGETTLFLAHQVLDPARVEAAFSEHVVRVEGRGLDRTSGDPREVITRLWGTDATGRIQVAIFGREAVGLEKGRFAPLRVAELFAQGKLKRASPALHGASLARAAELVGDGVVRAFAPGPFTGEWRQGLGGLLGASTGAAVSVRVLGDGTPQTNAGADPGAPPRLAVTFVILGAWGDDAERAGQRLLVEFDILAQTSVGRLVGLDHPADGPKLHVTPDALSLDFSLDALTFAKGLHAATGARVDEIMAP